MSLEIYIYFVQEYEIYKLLCTYLPTNAILSIFLWISILELAYILP